MVTHENRCFSEIHLDVYETIKKKIGILAETRIY